MMCEQVRESLDNNRPRGLRNQFVLLVNIGTRFDPALVSFEHCSASEYDMCILL